MNADHACAIPYMKGRGERKNGRTLSSRGSWQQATKTNSGRRGVHLLRRSSIGMLYMESPYGTVVLHVCSSLSHPRKKNSQCTFININPACFHSDDVNKILKGDNKVNFQMIQSESSCSNTLTIGKLH